MEEGELLETTIVLLASHLLLLQCMRFVLTSSGEVHISYRGSNLILTRAHLERCSLEEILDSVTKYFKPVIEESQIPIVEEVAIKFLTSTTAKNHERITCPKSN